MNGSQKTFLLCFHFIVILLLCLPVPGWSATISAISASYSDVSAAIASATNGDTVIIPAGTATWSSGITVSKELKIIGAGKTATVITYTGTLDNAFTFIADNWRLSGIGFILPVNNVNMISASGQGWRIDHCQYTNNSKANDPGGNPSRTFIQTTGAGADDDPVGVIDNNTIINGRIAPMIYLSSVSQNHSWNKPLGLGSGNSVYIEDNTFTRPDLAGGKNVADTNYGGYYVFRYNNVDGQYVSFHPMGPGNSRSSKKWECYGNVMASNSNSSTGPFYAAGGTGVMFNNTARGYTNVNAPEIEDARCRAGDASDNITIQGKCDGDNAYDGNTPGQNGYPCRDQIGRGPDVSLLTFGSPPYPAQPLSPAYFWGNMSGSTYQATNVINGTNAWVQKNRDYYDYDSVACAAGGASCTAGVGCGTLAARPNNCTTGVGYWATNQSCTDMTGMVGAAPSTPIDGTLYKCTATNTWAAYYTPYTYPHPLTLDPAISPVSNFR